ncbi:hypothetical protein [Streptomyces sp. NPDC046909]|uniref:hypothetical protein n=1 Tax=Streptomyces sp. NPDC046909 TaxID=3155617 RepID=UPI0033CC0E89
MGFLLFLVAGFGVLLLVFGVGRRVERDLIEEFVELPGGAWAVGGALGVVSVLGWVGGTAVFGVDGAVNKWVQGRSLRVARWVGGVVCWGAALGPFVLLFSGLPGKNCRSSACEYVPGTGPAFLAYAVVAGGLGYLWRWWWRGVLEAQEAERRERMRKLRKRGKGKSRAARQR